MSTRRSALAMFPVEIQDDLQGEYIRIVIQGVSVLEGEEVTAQGLADLFAEMGFDVKLVRGCFGGQNDDQYEDAGCTVPKFVPLEVVVKKSGKMKHYMDVDQLFPNVD
jgi:hypothetical protein